MSFYTKELGDLIPRTERREVNGRLGIDERTEPRRDDLINSAVLTFRDARYDVPVLNISSRGTMIESDIAPRIGETVSIQFEACDRIGGFVRWVRDGRIGINFGHELILG